MSDIPRYRPVSNDRYGITDDADGKLCEYRDYARLKAEVVRLTAFTTHTIIPNEELQAQVERLTEAGDNMYSWLGVCGRHNNSIGDDWLRAKKGLPLLTEQWEDEKRNRAAENAAKEGKQS